MEKSMKKRKWVYIQKPSAYEISCDRCGGHMITWSEYEHMIWCYQCKIDTPGTGGVFDGPIPLEAAKMLGLSFDRIYLRDNSIRRMELKNGKCVWRKLKQEVPERRII